MLIDIKMLLKSTDMKHLSIHIKLYFRGSYHVLFYIEHFVENVRPGWKVSLCWGGKSLYNCHAKMTFFSKPQIMDIRYDFGKSVIREEHINRNFVDILRIKSF